MASYSFRGSEICDERNYDTPTHHRSASGTPLCVDVRRRIPATINHSTIRTGV